ncbi:MAG: hypothetical protein A2057_15560 [Ignavibacteria bacterium GWA2_35_9]|nr:MAG: hypothetical protein A2057_15560 [Ignavibacteria bacterium GWA2_35_9]OGU48348.1 MAG: hypothetical protein A2000_09475 [Ignavibacteria bacterium GWB2_36_8]OGU53721.1 MAG: hypothetical protein A2080_06720 [Ignavibacteria bacterium GWC2_36_12]
MTKPYAFKIKRMKFQLSILLKKYCLIFLTFIFFISNTLVFSKNSIETDTTVVERYGQLRVEGNKIVDKNSNPVSLRGMCLFWSQWMGRFYNYDCVEWLKDDWMCTVVRASMGIESGGYLQNPTIEKNKITAVIDACIDLGIYVIVDWHDHNAHNHQQEAIDFFTEIAEQYGEYPNLIYEIYNEPTQVSWTNVIKPYAEAVVDSIRAIDPDNIIIVGTSTWSQDVDIASQSPLEFDNIAYALHFYAATHKQSLRNKASTALNNGIALFVSEFGTCESTGDGPIDYTEVESWMNFMETNKISWCNWSIADKVETSAALMPGVSSNGGWSESDLTESGSLIRDKIIFFNDTTNTGIGDLRELPKNFKLYQNYPNPFNPITTIEYELQNNGQVILDVLDLNGRKIKTLKRGFETKGNYKVSWDGSSDKGIKVSSGVYFYRLFFENKNNYKKAILLN